MVFNAAVLAAVWMQIRGNRARSEGEIAGAYAIAPAARRMAARGAAIARESVKKKICISFAQNLHLF
jgi:hypothetical protein